MKSMLSSYSNNKSQKPTWTCFWTKWVKIVYNFIGNVLPEIYETESQIITIKVENNTPQKCYDQTTLEFIVDDSPESYEVIINSQCDDTNIYCTDPA